jgi:hypothetical protein
LRTTTPIAAAGASRSLASSCGTNASSSSANPSRAQNQSTTGAGPNL